MKAQHETSEETRDVLRARAKKLAQEPEEEEAAGEIIEALAFLLAQEMYAVESRFIREVHPLKELTPLPCTPDYVFGIITIRGDIVTVIDIKKLLNLPERGITDLNRVIVVRNETMELGILADEILGIRDIPTQGIHPPLPAMAGIHAQYVRGVTDTNLILLDVENLLGDGRLVVHEEVAE